jgi:hypothetical protein
MAQIYFLIFWIPAVASAVGLLISLRSGLLNRAGLFVIWFGVALLMQVAGSLFSPLWAIGLVLQAVLAIYLALKIKFGQIQP